MRTSPEKYRTVPTDEVPYRTKVSRAVLPHPWHHVQKVFQG